MGYPVDGSRKHYVNRDREHHPPGSVHVPQEGLHDEGGSQPGEQQGGRRRDLQAVLVVLGPRRLGRPHREVCPIGRKLGGRCLGVGGGGGGGRERGGVRQRDHRDDKGALGVLHLGAGGGKAQTAASKNQQLINLIHNSLQGGAPARLVGLGLL